MNFKNIINVLMGNNNKEETNESVNHVKSNEPKVEPKIESKIEPREEQVEEEEEYIGDLPESTIRDIFIDLYSQLDIQPTKRIYRIFLDGWKDGLVNLETTTVKGEITAPKDMDEFSNLCMAFKGMLEEQLNEELDVNFVRGYCYCLCFFMPNK